MRCSIISKKKKKVSFNKEQQNIFKHKSGNLPEICKDCNRYLILQSPCDNPESCYRLTDKTFSLKPQEESEPDYTDYWNQYLEKNYPKLDDLK